MYGKWWGTFIKDMVNLKREQTSSCEPHKVPEKEAFDILKHQLQALVQTNTLNVVVNQNCCVVWLSGFPIIHTRKMTSYHSTHPSASRATSVSSSPSISVAFSWISKFHSASSQLLRKTITLDLSWSNLLLF